RSPTRTRTGTCSCRPDSSSGARCARYSLRLRRSGSRSALLRLADCAASGPGWSVEADDAHADRTEHGLRAVAGVELLVDRREVVLPRLLADVELLRDLGGRAPVGDELEDLFLPLRHRPVAVAAVDRLEPAHLVQHRGGEAGGEGRVVVGREPHGFG